MLDENSCKRPGCGNPRPLHKGHGHKPYCSKPCRLWHRAFVGFNENGAAPGRDSATDAVLFAGLLALNLDIGASPVLRELFETYGQAA
jgi:hypothetical protein